MATHSRADIEILKIPTDYVSAMLPHVRHFLCDGLGTPRDANLGSLISDLVSGTDHLWIIMSGKDMKAAFCTAFHDDESLQGQFLAVYGLGGSGLRLWADHLGETMTAFATSHNCRAVRFKGRKAWFRVLPSFVAAPAEGGLPVHERIIP